MRVIAELQNTNRWYQLLARHTSARTRSKYIYEVWVWHPPAIVKSLGSAAWLLNECKIILRAGVVHTTLICASCAVAVA
jgi:hypothetical protein